MGHDSSTRSSTAPPRRDAGPPPGRPRTHAPVDRALRVPPGALRRTRAPGRRLGAERDGAPALEVEDGVARRGGIADAARRRSAVAAARNPTAPTTPPQTPRSAHEPEFVFEPAEEARQAGASARGDVEDPALAAEPGGVDERKAARDGERVQPVLRPRPVGGVDEQVRVGEHGVVIRVVEALRAGLDDRRRVRLPRAAAPRRGPWAVRRPPSRRGPAGAGSTAPRRRGRAASDARRPPRRAPRPPGTRSRRRPRPPRGRGLGRRGRGGAGATSRGHATEAVGRHRRIRGYSPSESTHFVQFFS